MTPPRVLFVGDNRRNLNWGRGASIALAGMLSSAFDIAGTVPGELFDLATAEAGYVGTLMPGRGYPLFRYCERRSSRRPFGWYLKLEQLYGARDFINADPRESVRRLRRQHHRYPALSQLYDAACRADAFVVDGDGDIVFSTPPRRQTLFLLAMIELGLLLGKPVFLVNTMLSDCPRTGRNLETVAYARRLLARCRAVSLRDPESIEYARETMPEVATTLIPDSLFAWDTMYAGVGSGPPANGNLCLPYPESQEWWGQLDFSVPYLCIGGGALSASHPERAIEAYGRLADALATLGCRIYLTVNDLPDRFLEAVARERRLGLVPVNVPIAMAGAILAHARLFVSGRYHPSILSSLGGTPCLFLGSHAHKMASLSRVLEYDEPHEFSAFPADEEIAGMLSLAQRYLSQGEALRERIRAVVARRGAEARTLPSFFAHGLATHDLDSHDLDLRLDAGATA